MQREEIKSRQKYQNWCPLAPQLPFLVTDEKRGGDFEYFMSPLQALPYRLLCACPPASAGRFSCTRCTSHSSGELPKEAFLPVTHTSLNNCLVHSFPKVTMQYLPTGRIHLNLTRHQNVSVLFKLQVRKTEIPDRRTVRHIIASCSLSHRNLCLCLNTLF